MINLNLILDLIFSLSINIVIYSINKGSITSKNPKLCIILRREATISIMDMETKTCLMILILFFSPIRIGTVSLPVILSPCIPSMSSKAVVTNTSPVEKANATQADMVSPEFDIAGRIEVTVPHAIAIRTVLAPGISFIRFIFLIFKKEGIIFKLYESPNILIINSKAKPAMPVVNDKERPMTPKIHVVVPNRM